MQNDGGEDLLVELSRDSVWMLLQARRRDERVERGVYVAGKGEERREYIFCFGKALFYKHRVR
jgi:hypothetical protein